MVDRRHSPGIENFNLFGEIGELPDIVHCETIQARSQLHNWEFKPHRHARLHQVLLMEQGGGAAVLEVERRPLASGVLINVPIGCVHSFVFQEDTTGWVVTLAAEVLDDALREDEGLRRGLERPFVGGILPEAVALVRQIFAEHGGRAYGRAHMLRALSALLLGLVARCARDLDQSDGEGSDSTLRHRFEVLVEAHFAEHWSVAAYARALSVSAPHLSRVVRQATGMPASQVIAARLVREARRQLHFTNLGVAQIAYLLGYSDPAYFTRVFTKATGVSPSAFRQEAGRAAVVAVPRPIVAG